MIHVYPFSVYKDVSAAFKRWTKSGLKLYIYSSGSVPAQKLLFANTEHGDLSPFLSGYFDTKIGAKVDSSSYLKIAEDIQVDPSDILFFTDMIKEVEAAKKANIKVVVTSRPGNLPLTDDDKLENRIIETFDEISVKMSSWCIK